jgi:hypothetical protein
VGGGRAGGRGVDRTSSGGRVQGGCGLWDFAKAHGRCGSARGALRLGWPLTEMLCPSAPPLRLLLLTTRRPARCPYPHPYPRPLLNSELPDLLHTHPELVNSLYLCRPSS